MAKDLNKTIEELKSKILELGGTLTYERQHGKAGISKEDEKEELIRLRNNLASQLSRLKKKKITEEQVYDRFYDIDHEPDEYGINKVDERRFKNCFCLENINPELSYVQRMTGLTSEQIRRLELKFHLRVSRKKVI